MATKSKTRKTEENGERVTPNATVMFKWNNKSGFHQNGTQSGLHPVQAKKMKEKGFGDIIEGSYDDTSTKGIEQDVSAGGASETV